MENFIDNIDDFEKSVIKESDIIYSNLYPVRIGGFGVDDNIVTYNCSVKLSNLKKDVDTYEKLTADKSWPVSEIVQREIDLARVKRIVKDYILKKDRRVKYFPPIIVALLPKSEEDRIANIFKYGKLVTEKTRREIFDKSKFRESKKVVDHFIKASNLTIAENLFLLNIYDSLDYNILCWDKREYYAIVIDGQHRYKSLLTSSKSNPEIENYKLDVAFVDVSFLVKKEKNTTPVEAIRSVFIDINANAKRVSHVRQILMDDKDLAALFVQSLVNDAENSTNDRKGTYIPPQIIDWHVENFKHELPHLTSILILYQIMCENFLGYNPTTVKELQKPSAINNWVSRLNDTFAIDDIIRDKFSDYKTLSKSLEEFKLSNDGDSDSDSLAIFNYDYRIWKDIALKQFEEKYSRSIVSVITDLLPYKKVINLLKKEGTFDKQNNRYNSLILSPEKRKKNDTYLKLFQDLKTSTEENFKKEYYLIYTVLGQKAIFERYFRVLHRDLNSMQDNIQEITSDFINELNRVFEIISLFPESFFGENTVKIKVKDKKLGTIVTSFWEGIIYFNKSIVYNKHGVDTLSSFIEYLIEYIGSIIEGKEMNSKIAFNKINRLEGRTKRLIKKNFEEFEESDIEEQVKYIINIKQKYIESNLNEAIEKWKQKN
jgi:hypothetical protein